MTLVALSTNASPNGWINEGETRTVGNNVDAHTDLAADDPGYDTVLPAPNPPRPSDPNRVFAYPLDFNQEPNTLNNQNAAVVHAFYWVNWMQDKLYDLGFTEAAGNFQRFNLGRGGVEGDPVLMDVQDSAQKTPTPTYNIGNFIASPDDGGVPAARIFIGIYGSTNGGPVPKRDGSLETELLLHEYAHLLSVRRVVGIRSDAQADKQAKALSEGWSDFYAIALLSAAGDAANGNYPYSAYSVYRFNGNEQELTENYYFGGFRRFPYSTGMTNNPLTLNDIDPSDAVSRRPIPVNPTHLQYPPPDEVNPEGFNPGLALEEHTAGEVWCVTLWDARANLIQKSGFSAGNDRILKLVTAGMDHTTASPDFLDARDGVLAADQATPPLGADRKELWAAFYKRGMGASAVVLANPTPPNAPFVLEAFNKADFNLDGQQDVVFQSSGFLKTWSMTNNATRLLEENISPDTDSSWRVKATSDINRDGKVDLIFQDVNGFIAEWDMNGTTMTASSYFSPNHPGPGWKISATGDINRDSKADLVWQHDNGQLAVWFMNGTNLISSSLFNPDVPSDTRWRVTGTGDFDRDGQIDLLFQFDAPGDSTSGLMAVWHLNKTNSVALRESAMLNPNHPGNVNWRIVGAEDFNRDGFVDLLFQYKDPPSANHADLAYWYLNATNLVAFQTLNPINPGNLWDAVGPK